MKWALGKKKHALEQAKKLASLVQALHDLVPPHGTATQREGHVQTEPQSTTCHLPCATQRIDPGWSMAQTSTEGSPSLNSGSAAVSRSPNTMELWFVGADGSV